MIICRHYIKNVIEQLIILYVLLLLFSSLTWKLSKISQKREKVTSYVVERYKEMWYGTQQFVAKTLKKVRKEKKGKICMIKSERSRKDTTSD